MNKSLLKIRFVDFWSTCDYEHHVLTTALRENFDVEIVNDDDADITFFSVFGDKHFDLPENAIKIFYTGENVVPDFNLCDYAIAFEWMDYGDRYFRLPNYYNMTFKKDTELMAEKHLHTEEYLAQKEMFCSFVVSNGNNAAPIRQQMFEKLSAYKRVSSGGRFMNNVGGPVADKRAFETKHKFSIAFENSSHAGYSTEKIVQSFAVGTVPIYWGDPEICRIFNKEAFVNVADFASLDEVVEYVKFLDNNPDEYLKKLSAPALASDEFRFEMVYQNLVDFLYHIASQSKVSAQRHNREFWGKLYAETYKGWRDESRISLKERLKRILISKLLH